MSANDARNYRMLRMVVTGKTFPSNSGWLRFSVKRYSVTVKKYSK